jgi:hypothetical protein
MSQERLKFKGLDKRYFFHQDGSMEILANNNHGMQRKPSILGLFAVSKK